MHLEIAKFDIALIPNIANFANDLNNTLFIFLKDSLLMI